MSGYEAAPFPQLSEAQLRGIVERAGLRVDTIEPMHSTGVVHALWALDDRYVLRVPKNEAMCLGDLHAEVAAIPVARDVGVRTPRLVAFDPSGEIVDVPYVIVERVHGVDLASLAEDDPRLPGLYRQLGRQLAMLHTAPIPPPHPWFRNPEPTDVEPLLDQVIAAGLLGRTQAARLLAMVEDFDRAMVEDLGNEPPRLGFLHGDIKLDNLMVDMQGDLVLIDWGDAGIGDPALEFQSLPIAVVETVLADYLPLAGRDDPTLERRIRRELIARAVADLRRAPLLGPSWYRPIATRLADLLLFATTDPNSWARPFLDSRSPRNAQRPDPHASGDARRRDVTVDAVVVVDAQCGLLAGAEAIPGAQSIVAAISTLVRGARASGAPVIWLQNDGPSGAIDEPGTAGWQLIAEADVRPDELVIRKPVDDGFDGTGLGSSLDHLGVRRVVICGALSEMCVSATARGALGRGLSVVLPRDAHGTYDVPADRDIPMVPEAVAARVAEWSLGDGITVVDRATDVGFTRRAPA